MSLGSYLTEGGKDRVSSMDKGLDEAKETSNNQAGAGQLHLSHQALVATVEVPRR